MNNKIIILGDIASIAIFERILKMLGLFSPFQSSVAQYVKSFELALALAWLANGRGEEKGRTPCHPIPSRHSTSDVCKMSKFETMGFVVYLNLSCHLELILGINVSEDANKIKIFLINTGCNFSLTADVIYWIVFRG